MSSTVIVDISVCDFWIILWGLVQDQWGDKVLFGGMGKVKVCTTVTSVLSAEKGLGSSLEAAGSKSSREMPTVYSKAQGRLWATAGLDNLWKHKMLRCRVLLSLSPCILVSAYSSLQQFLPMEDITQVRGSDSMTVSMVFHIKDHAVQTPLFMFFSKGRGACVLYHKAEYTSGLFRFLRNNFNILLKTALMRDHSQCHLSVMYRDTGKALESKHSRTAPQRKKTRAVMDNRCTSWVRNN